MISRIAAGIALATTLFACSKGDRTATDSGAVTTPSPSAAATGTGAMSGPMTQGGMAGMHADTLAERVENHLKRLESASGAGLKALVSEDRSISNELIADCEKMMRMEKMTPPRKWNTAVAQMRTDLRQMASANGDELDRLAKDHAKHIRDMLGMRHDMMKDMKM